MKKNRKKSVGLILFIALFATGCNLTTFSGQTSSRWKNDIIYQTIKWDAHSTEADVEREFRNFVRETLTRQRYANYVQLYQSNYGLNEGERTYVIKIFNNEQAKRIYLQQADDIIRQTTALASNDFKQRWNRLEQDMLVEDVYNLLPELATYKAKQVFYSNRSELTLGNRWLSFDLFGHLINFGDNNLPQHSSPAKTSEDWVF